MFALHDRTRRQLCRTAFALVCIVPTLGVLAWAGLRSSGSHREQCAARLSQSLGMSVALSGVSYPRPGITLYAGVELADSETGATLARVRFLESGGTDDTSTWVASQPEIDSAQLPHFWQLLSELLRQTSDLHTTLRLTAAEATLHGSSGSQTLTGVVGQLESPREPDAPRVATLSFRIAGLDTPEPISLRITRQCAAHHNSPPFQGGAGGGSDDHSSRSQFTPTTTIELHTGGAALPIGMLTVPLGVANHLGQRAKFRGSIWATETPDGCDGELSGQFSDVDLQSLVAEQFPHRLSGTAEITLQKARIRHGRLEEATGTITAGPGIVGQSLLAAAVEHLHLIRGAALPTPGAMLEPNAALEYEQLALSWAIDSTGLTLHGQCGGASGVILRSRDGVLLRDAVGSSGPVVALLRTLVPQSEVQVPATRQSDWLMARLPLPRVIPPPDHPPQGRLRLQPTEGD